MVKLKFKIRLFKAVCISILIYGSETWNIRKPETLAEKLYISERIWYRIMLGIKQFRNHVTNQRWTCTSLLAMFSSARRSASVNLCSQVNVSTFQQKKVIYESRIKSSLRPGTPRTAFLNQIWSHILQSGEKSLEAGDIRKMMVNKFEWSQIFWCLRKKKPPTVHLSSYDDDSTYYHKNI